MKGQIKINPVLTVVTIAYNAEKFIEKAVSSVIAGDYRQVEYIIIDGGSTDGTLDIIKKYDDRIDFWISEPDKGISDAFNKGFSYSAGAYIAYLNADDWYEPGILEEVTKSLSSETTIYCGHMNLIAPDGSRALKLHRSQPDRLFQTMRIAHPATFVPRKVFDVIGGFSSEYKVAMDYDFLLRARLNGFTFSVLNLIITNQLLGGNSSDLKQAFRDELRIKNKYLPNKVYNFTWFIMNILFHKWYISIKNKFLR